MSQKHKKYIITGAPGTGKTTLINLLNKEIPCMEEVSRRVIIEEQKKGGDGVPWQNIKRFTDLVYQKSIDELNKKTASVFCDRSLLDLIAYLNMAGEPIPEILNNFPYKETFHSIVFFAPTWQEIYCKDEQRLQEYDYCKKLEKVLRNEYIKRGFTLVTLPKNTPQSRVHFIKSQLAFK